MKQETGETGDGRCETGDRIDWRQERLETGGTGDRRQDIWETGET